MKLPELAGTPLVLVVVLQIAGPQTIPVLSQHLSSIGLSHLITGLSCGQLPFTLLHTAQVPELLGHEPLGQLPDDEDELLVELVEEPDEELDDVVVDDPEELLEEEMLVEEARQAIGPEQKRIMPTL